MLIDVSIGEVFDKVTILEIKRERIKDIGKLFHIEYELNILNETLRNSFKKDSPTFPEELYNSLKLVNEQLWDLEDVLREKEKNKCYDEEFIKCAEGDSVLNDKRFLIKNEINNWFKSDIKEQKSYKHLDYKNE
jgi:hypothetical protein